VGNYHHGPPQSFPCLHPKPGKLSFGKAAGHSTGHPSITFTYPAPSTGPWSSTSEGKRAITTTCSKHRTLELHLEGQAGNYHHGPPLHVPSSKHSTLELHLRSKFAVTTTDPRGQPGTAPDTHQLRPRTVLQAQDLRASLGRASAQTRPRTPEGSRAQYRTPINYLHVPCYRHRRDGNSKIWRKGSSVGRRSSFSTKMPTKGQ